MRLNSVIYSIVAVASSVLAAPTLDRGVIASTLHDRSADICGTLEFRNGAVTHTLKDESCHNFDQTTELRSYDILEGCTCFLHRAVGCDPNEHWVKREGSSRGSTQTKGLHAYVCRQTRTEDSASAGSFTTGGVGDMVIRDSDNSLMVLSAVEIPHTTDAVADTNQDPVLVVARDAVAERCGTAYHGNSGQGEAMMKDNRCNHWKTQDYVKHAQINAGSTCWFYLDWNCKWRWFLDGIGGPGPKDFVMPEQLQRVPSYKCY